jgi:hypothetical protein
MAQTITIASGGTLSSAAEVKGQHTYGVIIVPTIDSATITWAISNDNTTFYALYDHLGTAQQISATTANRAFSIPAGVLASNYFKIQVGAAQNSGAVTITVLLSNG